MPKQMEKKGTKMEEETKKLYCKKCKRKTEHLKSGFGEVGSIVGNSRYRCLTCSEERI